MLRKVRSFLIPRNSWNEKLFLRLFAFPIYPFTLRQNYALLRGSGLFDEAWYLSKNPDVVQAKVDPLLHYLRYGGFEGRDPGPDFSSAWYLDTYQDVKKAGFNPMVHYLKYGRQEGCLPHFNKSILLTVIIVTYNHKDSIAKAIDSVLDQETTYPYEIWVCDDCSTDGTLAICKEYAEKYSNKIKLYAQPVNLFSQPKKLSNQNMARKRVDTKYFSILEGDDAWCDKQKIQISLDFLEKNPEFTTFAHDTLVNDIPNHTKKSLVHEVQKTEIKNPMVFENAIYLHMSSRVHRNVIKYSENQNGLDIFLFYNYLDRGPLYFYDKIMSVYNITGKGAWSRLSAREVEIVNIYLQGLLNKYFKYQYDEFFTSRAGIAEMLEPYKKRFGKKLTWEFWLQIQAIKHHKLIKGKYKFKVYV
jgi:glycosyltransferase involved in cell wall biosynthesis